MVPYQHPETPTCNLPLQQLSFVLLALFHSVLWCRDLPLQALSWIHNQTDSEGDFDFLPLSSQTTPTVTGHIHSISIHQENKNERQQIFSNMHYINYDIVYIVCFAISGAEWLSYMNKPNKWARLQMTPTIDLLKLITSVLQKAYGIPAVCTRQLKHIIILYPFWCDIFFCTTD